MTKKLLSFLQYLIFMGGGLLLVWWQFHDFKPAEKNEFISAIRSVNYWFLLPVAIMSIASHISRSMRWKLLMSPLGFEPKLSNTFAVTMVGYLANAAVPRLGELLKCTMLARYERLKADKLIGTILLERSIDLLCYVLFIAITFLIQMKTIGAVLEGQLEKITPGKNSLFVWKLSAGLVLFLLAIFLIRFFAKKYPTFKLFVFIANSIKGILDGIKGVRKLTSVRAFLGHTLFIWLMYLGQIYLGFLAMGGTAHLTVAAACSVLTLATLAMIVTPGGIGSFPFFVMQTLLLYGIDSAQGKAFGWIMWGASTTIVIMAGLISLIALPYLNRQPIENSLQNSKSN